jgi:hypothetical protein
MQEFMRQPGSSTAVKPERNDQFAANAALGLFAGIEGASTAHASCRQDRLRA